MGHDKAGPVGVEVTDDDLVRRLKAADEQALAALYDRYSALAFSLALRMVGSTEGAEDVVQEAFYRLWRQAGSYDPGRARLSTWIANITRNLCIDELRRRAARPQTTSGPEADTRLIELAASDQADPADQVWAAHRREAVLAALAELPPQQREAVELAYFGGLSQSEIAQRLGDPLGTVKTRIRAGMQRLREHMGSEWWSQQSE